MAEPPSNVTPLVKLRFVIAPPLIIAIEVFLMIAGLLICGQGLFRFWRPKYQLVENKTPTKRVRKATPAIRASSVPKRRTGNVVINMSFNKAFNEDDELSKEAVSLLSIKEEMLLPELMDEDS